MTFAWPSMLLLLLALPVLVFLYVCLQRRQRERTLRFRWTGTRQPSGGPSVGLRRHIAPLLFLASLAILIVSLARPQTTVEVPRVEGTVMLVVDVSASMAAGDAEPNRLEAAKEVARQFVQEQPATVQIGVVAFSGGGIAIQQPTDNTAAVLAAIDRLRPESGTSVGQGLLVALNTIALDAGLVPEESEPPNPEQQSQEQPVPPEARLIAELPPGPYPSSVIVLLSDGENTQSFDPLEAAAAAADRDVPVHTLGFGTPAGTTLEVGDYQVHTALDEAALQQIAQNTGGVYFNAAGAQDLQAVYTNLVPQFVIKPETMEITSLLAGASIAVMLAGAAVSMLMFNRLP